MGIQRKDWRLKEQFMNSIKDNDMMTKIIRELTMIKKTNKITCEQVLCWANIGKTQRA